MSRCLYCYQPLAANQQDFHASCSKKIFGQPIPPALPYSEADLEPLAKEVIQSQTAITGVQAKLSLLQNSATATRSSAPEILSWLFPKVVKRQILWWRWNNPGQVGQKY